MGEIPRIKGHGDDKPGTYQQLSIPDKQDDQELCRDYRAGQEFAIEVLENESPAIHPERLVRR